MPTNFTEQYGLLRILNCETCDLQTYSLQPGRHSIGSSLEAKIRIYNKYIQPLHCIIHVYENKLATLIATSTLYPTNLNNKSLRKDKVQLLKPGDIIELGGIHIAYENSSLTKEEIAASSDVIVKPSQLFRTPLRRKSTFLSTPKIKALRTLLASPRSAPRTSDERHKKEWKTDIITTTLFPSSNSSSSLEQSKSDDHSTDKDKKLKPVTSIKSASKIPRLVGDYSNLSLTDTDSEVSSSHKFTRLSKSALEIFDLTTPLKKIAESSKLADVTQSDMESSIMLEKTPSRRSSIQTPASLKSKSKSFSAISTPFSASKSKAQTPTSTIIKTPKSILKRCSSMNFEKSSKKIRYIEDETPPDLQKSVRRSTRNSKSDQSFSTSALSPINDSHRSETTRFMQEEDIGEPYDRSKISIASTSKHSFNDEASHVSSVESSSFEYFMPSPSTSNRQTMSVFQKNLSSNERSTRTDLIQFTSESEKNSTFNMSGISELTSTSQTATRRNSQSLRKSLSRNSKVIHPEDESVIDVLNDSNDTVDVNGVENKVSNLSYSFSKLKTDSFTAASSSSSSSPDRHSTGTNELNSFNISGVNELVSTPSQRIIAQNTRNSRKSLRRSSLRVAAIQNQSASVSHNDSSELESLIDNDTEDSVTVEVSQLSKLVQSRFETSLPSANSTFLESNLSEPESDSPVTKVTRSCDQLSNKIKQSLRQLNSPKNDLTNVSGPSTTGVKTPRAQKSPHNDLTNVFGVKKLMKTPKIQNSPKNELEDVSGLKRLLKTPGVQNSPENDLRDVRGIKRLMKTPKVQRSPENDLRNIFGVKKLMATPKVQRPPENDLQDVAGVKQLMKTPKAQRSPENDLRNVRGVKRLMKTPKVQHSPKNDLRDVKGIKRLMRTPKVQYPPKNDLSDVRGVKKLLRTPKLQSSPLNTLEDVSGVSRLFKAKSPRNDLTNVSGISDLFNNTKASTSKDSDTNERGSENTDLNAEEEAAARNDLNVSGVVDTFQSADTSLSSQAFDLLINKKPVRTYRGKSSSPAKLNRLATLRRSVGAVPAVSPDVVEWVETHSKYIEKDNVSVLSEPLITEDSTKAYVTPLKRSKRIASKTPSSVKNSVGKKLRSVQSSAASDSATATSRSTRQLVASSRNTSMAEFDFSQHNITDENVLLNKTKTPKRAVVIELEQVKKSVTKETSNILKDLQNLTPVLKDRNSLKTSFVTPLRRSIKENVTPTVQVSRMEELMVTPKVFVSPAEGDSTRKSKRSHVTPTVQVSRMDELMVTPKVFVSPAEGNSTRKDKRSHVTPTVQELMVTLEMLVSPAEGDSTRKSQRSHQKPVRLRDDFMSDIDLAVKVNNRSYRRSSTKKTDPENKETDEAPTDELIQSKLTPQQTKGKREVKETDVEVIEPKVINKRGRKGSVKDTDQSTVSIDEEMIEVKAKAVRKRKTTKTSNQKPEYKTEQKAEEINEVKAKVVRKRGAPKASIENIEDKSKQQIEEIKPVRKRGAKRSNKESGNESENEKIEVEGEKMERTTRKRGRKKVEAQPKASVDEDEPVKKQRATRTRENKKVNGKKEIGTESESSRIDDDQVDVKTGATRRRGAKQVDDTADVKNANEVSDTVPQKKSRTRATKKDYKDIQEEEQNNHDSLKDDQENSSDSQSMNSQRSTRKRTLKKDNNKLEGEQENSKTVKREESQTVGQRSTRNRRTKKTDAGDQEKVENSKSLTDSSSDISEIKSTESQRVTRKRGAKKTVESNEDIEERQSSKEDISDTLSENSSVSTRSARRVHFEMSKEKKSKQVEFTDENFVKPNEKTTRKRGKPKAIDVDTDEEPTTKKRGNRGKASDVKNVSDAPVVRSTRRRGNKVDYDETDSDTENSVKSGGSVKKIKKEVEVPVRKSARTRR